MLPRQKEISRTAFMVVCECQCLDADDGDLIAGHYLLGVASVISADPTVNQRNRRADSVGEVIPDQQSDLVAVIVG